MLKPTLARLIILCGLATPVAAQVTPFSQADPAKMAALTANSMRTMKPASYVLAHKSELALTDRQIEQITILTRAEDDSAATRSFRMEAMMARLMEKRQEENNEPQTGWNGPVNESQIREKACEQLGVGTETMINLFRDRRAVGDILTGKQISIVQQLEMSDMMRILRPTKP